MCSCFVFILLRDWNSKIRKLNWKHCPMTTVESRSANPLLLICNPPSSSAKQNNTKFSRLKTNLWKNRPSSSSSSSSSCTKINRNLIVNLAPWKKKSIKKKMQSFILVHKNRYKKKSKKFDLFCAEIERNAISIKEYLNLVFSAVKEWRSWIDAALGFGWCLLKSKAAAASCVASCSNNSRAAVEESIIPIVPSLSS